MTELQREVRYAIDTILRDRGYDQHAADAEVYAQTLDELTEKVLETVADYT